MRDSVHTLYVPSQREMYQMMVASARQGVAQSVWSAAWDEGAARPDEAIAEMLGHV